MACVDLFSRLNKSRIVVCATIGLIVIAATFLGTHARSPFIVQAAVSFEVRLAEDKPANGLREAKVSGSERPVYVHDEVIVSNSDIAAARVVQGRPTQYGVSVEFTASGAEKMRAATASHIGRPVAIFIDAQLVVAPVVRTPIAASAILTGNYTKAQAERIVKGLVVQ